MTVSWPPTLPQCPLVANIKGEPKDNLIIGTVPAGQDKYRKRFSAVTTKWPISLMMTQAQWVVLQEFYDTNTTNEWLWIDPDNGDPAYVVFASQPKLTGRDANHRFVSFTIEVQL